MHDFIGNCLDCLISNSAVNSSEGELQITKTSIQPFQILYTDDFGLLKETSDGYKHILVLIDTFTRFTWFFPVKTTFSKKVIKQFVSLFRILDKSKEIISDKGAAFTSQKFGKSLVLDISNIALLLSLLLGQTG